MDNSLKQRIVGAVVLIALAVIFLPAVLKDKIEREPFKTRVPAKPESLVAQNNTIQPQDVEISKKLDKIEKQTSRKPRYSTPRVIELTPKTTSTEKMVENKALVTKERIKPVPDKPTKSDTSKINSVKKADKKVSNQAVKNVTKSTTKVASKAKPKPQVNKKTNPTKKKVKETLNPKFKSAAWIIQVASFSSLTNAKKLVSKLKSAKYKAYRRKARNKQNKTIYRVFVGPYIEKTKATNVLDRVSSLSQTKVMLLVFDPARH